MKQRMTWQPSYLRLSRWQILNACKSSEAKWQLSVQSRGKPSCGSVDLVSREGQFQMTMEGSRADLMMLGLPPHTHPAACTGVWMVVASSCKSFLR